MQLNGVSESEKDTYVLFKRSVIDKRERFGIFLTFTIVNDIPF